MVCETQNLLTSQYPVYSEIPLNRNLYHIETSQAIYSPMQIIWMVLIDIRSLTRKGLEFFEVVQSLYLRMYLFGEFFSKQVLFLKKADNQFHIGYPLIPTRCLVCHI